MCSGEGEDREVPLSLGDILTVVSHPWGLIALHRSTFVMKMHIFLLQVPVLHR